MKKTIMVLIFAMVGAGLASCSTMSSDHNMTAENQANNPNLTAANATVLDETGKPVAVDASAPNGMPVAGNLQQNMDSRDKSKLFHALDSALGKSTTWTNPMTGTNYTVTPVQKLTVNGNPYCRQYTLNLTRNGRAEEINGTACVASDGNWQAVQ